MAILWWIASGTYNKMRSDVENNFNKGNVYWVHELMHSEAPLEIHHVLLAFLILCFGLVVAKFAFFAELICKQLVIPRYNKKKTLKRVSYK